MTPPVIDEKATGVAKFGDTKTQTMGVLGRIEAALKTQGATMADVVMMRVLLVGDPAKDGKMDFAGMMEAYKTYFGTRPAQQAVAHHQPDHLAGSGRHAGRDRGPGGEEEVIPHTCHPGSA
jgi:enamine deaminase RidA (YjgF/YER057c/UK114 family)